MKGAGIKAPSVARLDNSVKYINNLTTNAVLSRTMENYMEARGVWTETYESTKQELEKYTDQQWKDFYARNPELNGKTIDQIAKYIAGESADKTFINDYAMLGQDILQFRGIGQLFGKVGKNYLLQELDVLINKQLKIFVKKLMQMHVNQVPVQIFLKEVFGKIEQMNLKKLLNTL